MFPGERISGHQRTHGYFVLHDTLLPMRSDRVAAAIGGRLERDKVLGLGCKT
jgi:hypothetical protein